MTVAMEKIIRPLWRPSQFRPALEPKAAPSSAGDVPLLEWGGPGNFHDKQEVFANTDGFRTTGTRPGNTANGKEVERTTAIKTYRVEDPHTLLFHDGVFADRYDVKFVISAFGPPFGPGPHDRHIIGPVRKSFDTAAEAEAFDASLGFPTSLDYDIERIPNGRLVSTRDRHEVRTVGVEVDVEQITSITFEIPRMPFRRPSTEEIAADAADGIIDLTDEEFSGYHKAFVTFKFKAPK